ncbi:hypothetical protein N3K66_005673 [Trichothecium roseum]|uniref:Uncharacterized protein n=1 Tax=Trichothecium roseum TaxID=47278 RepID=A0ACC0UYI0_9HYPO|nr:hypothetical protein N3K66_005673 [Trichothecium roseum]
MAQPSQRPTQGGSAAWNVDLLHCSPGGSVFESIFRPWILYSQAEERLRNPYLENYQSPPCENCCQLSFLTPCYISKQRAKIRNKFGIAGSSGNDWMVACCCPCCALVQHDNEIESRNPKMRQNVDTQGYQANTNSMVMPERGSWYNSGDMAADMHRQSQR